ncbi:hypothetical protein H8959_014743, partial [Pygathrix nigripes]
MSWKIWRSTGKNTTNHVEVNFIEKFTSERRLHSSISCSITWFLSWSPCWDCSQAIREFLSQHPGVTLVIYVARLFWHTDQQNRQGLRDLVNSGVTIQMMTASDACFLRVLSLLEEFCQLPTWGRSSLATIPTSVDDVVRTGAALHNSKSSTLFKDFKKMAKSSYIFQTSSSKLPLPNDSTTHPFSYRADTAFCDLEMNRMIL